MLFLKQVLFSAWMESIISYLITLAWKKGFVLPFEGVMCVFEGCLCSFWKASVNDGPLFHFSLKSFIILRPTISVTSKHLRLAVWVIVARLTKQDSHRCVGEDIINSSLESEETSRWVVRMARNLHLWKLISDVFGDRVICAQNPGVPVGLLPLLSLPLQRWEVGVYVGSWRKVGWRNMGP